MFRMSWSIRTVHAPKHKLQASCTPCSTCSADPPPPLLPPSPSFPCTIYHPPFSDIKRGWGVRCHKQSKGLLQAVGPDGACMQAAAGSSAASAMEGWDSTDMDDFQEASSEVEGVPPSLHLLADPTIPVLIPTTQVQPKTLHWTAMPSCLIPITHTSTIMTCDRLEPSSTIQSHESALRCATYFNPHAVLMWTHASPRRKHNHTLLFVAQTLVVQMFTS